ncbi:MAG: beta-ketoacyl synthase chain length factor [Parvibaculum sp.]|nr:beta-ketoacyl synthase chain length factor [Parvibaculum sp.]
MNNVPLVAVYVESWAAVTFETPDSEAQRFGACADESIIPAGHRRRLSAFARMAVACGLSVSGADCSDLVFCSRFGDLQLAYRLLLDVVDGALMSPAAFSLSVHNSVPGVMDLVRKSRVGHTAVAGGDESLSAGLAESWGKLSVLPANKVTLVYAEGQMPDGLGTSIEMEQTGVAFAMTLSARRPAACEGVIQLGSVVDDVPVLEGPVSDLLVTRLIAALDTQPVVPLQWRSRGLRWSLKAGSDAAL